MPVTFIDLAQNCAPGVAIETLAGVVSLESRFEPYGIRVGAERPLEKQPTTKAEAIALASSLITEGKDVRLGLGGIGADELGKLKLSVADAFDPCLNLQATATLLDGYYRLAIRAGAGLPHAERVMLQSYYGRNDPTTGNMVAYDLRVGKEVERLAPKLSTLTIGQGTDEQSDPIEKVASADTSDVEAAPAPSEPQNVASWDVFNTARRSSVLIFQNNRSEQSE